MIAKKHEKMNDQLLLRLFKRRKPLNSKTDNYHNTATTDRHFRFRFLTYEDSSAFSIFLS